MRSVVVVIPASMWAMMPMLRVFSRGTCRAIVFFQTRVAAGFSPPLRTQSLTYVSFPVARSGTAEPPLSVLSGRDGAWGKLVNYKLLTTLPPIVRKGFIGLCHLVCIFPFLDRVAAVVGGIHDLAGELVLHRLLAATVREADQPSDRQGGAAGGPHFHRDLVVRSADAAALHFERRLHVV